MTRLKTEDICQIEAELKIYDAELAFKTGRTLSQIAAYAAGISDSEISREKVKIAAVPLTCGQGVIGGFSETVASIIRFMGFDAFTTKKADAGGIAEAITKGAQVLFLADDDKFVAINLAKGTSSDNGEATGRGFAAALDLMVDGVENKDILVIGTGPVGQGAAVYFAQRGARIAAHDKDPSAAMRFAEFIGRTFNKKVTLEEQLEQALQKHNILFDACPAYGFIKAEHVCKETFIAAPGVPLGIHSEALGQVARRLIHDPLQLGVAVMLFDALKP